MDKWAITRCFTWSMCRSSCDVILHMRSISFFLFTRVLCQTEKVKFYISIILQKIVGFSVKPSLFFHYKLMYESLIQYCDYIGKFYTLPYRSNHWIHTPSKHSNKWTEKPSEHMPSNTYGTVKCKVSLYCYSGAQNSKFNRPINRLQIFHFTRAWNNVSKVPDHGDWQSWLSLLFQVGNPAFLPIIRNFLPILDRLLFQDLLISAVSLYVCAHWQIYFVPSCRLFHNCLTPGLTLSQILFA